MDISEKAMDLDEVEDGEKDGEEQQGAEEMQEDEMDQSGEEKDQEPKTEEEGEEGEGERAEADEESAEKDEEGEEREKERGQEAGRDEDLLNDKGRKPEVCMCRNYCTYSNIVLLYFSLMTCRAHRMKRRKVGVRMMSSLSQLKGRNMTQTVRLGSRTSRVIQLWSWQERHQRETKLKRYTSNHLTPHFIQHQGCD